MDTPTVLQFEHNNNPIRFPVGEAETVASPFTGRELRKLKTQVTLSPLEVDLARALLASGEVTDSGESTWKGNIEMESYTNDGPHTLTISWAEVEHVMADAVEFEGLTLTPTRYEERTNEDDTIVISLQATLSKEETDRLRSLVAERSEVRYWPVIRRGVSDDPRNMRLGRVLWQQFEDGTIGHDVTLVDQAFDSSDSSTAMLSLAGEPQVGNLIRQVSSLLVQFETLLGELETSGVVARAAVERVRASADGLASARRHIFFEVSDLSEW